MMLQHAIKQIQMPSWWVSEKSPIQKMIELNRNKSAELTAKRKELVFNLLRENQPGMLVKDITNKTGLHKDQINLALQKLKAEGLANCVTVKVRCAKAGYWTAKPLTKSKEN